MPRRSTTRTGAAENTVRWAFPRDITRQNATNFRVFGPDETTSNKLDAITKRARSCGSPITAGTPMAANCHRTAASRDALRDTLEGWYEAIC